MPRSTPGESTRGKERKEFEGWGKMAWNPKLYDRSPSLIGSRTYAFDSYQKIKDLG